MFVGTFTPKIDDKGRLFLPAKFREAMAEGLVASIGTDGIDGLTDVAGALVDARSLARAAARGVASPTEVLARNDSFHFFSPLGDTVRTGRTDTNVGDLQVLLVNQ